MVSPAYKFGSTSLSIEGRSIKDLKIDRVWRFPIQRNIVACSSFQFLSAKVSTSLGN
jgi:hypothetical protein